MMVDDDWFNSPLSMRLQKKGEDSFLFCIVSEEKKQLNFVVRSFCCCCCCCCFVCFSIWRLVVVVVVEGRTESRPAVHPVRVSTDDVQSFSAPYYTRSAVVWDLE
jgi:hypothetical protein